jgi:hypothetical protein
MANFDLTNNSLLACPSSVYFSSSASSRSYQNFLPFRASVRVKIGALRRAPGCGHCVPQLMHLNPPGIGCLITLLHPVHGLDSGIVEETSRDDREKEDVPASIFPSCSFHHSRSP